MRYLAAMAMAVVVLAPAAVPQPVRDIKEIATRRFGKWTYRTYYTRAATRSRTTIGELSYDGKAVLAANQGDFLWSPWGKLLWHGKPFTRGWMRPAAGPLPEGKEVASPDPATSDRVRERIRHVEAGLKHFALYMSLYAPTRRMPGDPPWLPGRAGRGAGGTIVLATGPAAEGADGIILPAGVDRISERQARHITARLATEGFFAEALSQVDRKRMHATSPRQTRSMLIVQAGRRWWWLDIDWGSGILPYLDALREELTGEAAKSADAMLESLGKVPEQWRATERAARLKADPRTFRLWLRYTSEAAEPFHTLHYTTEPERPATYPAFLTVRHLSAEQASDVIDTLLASGLLAEAKEAAMPTGPQRIDGPGYVLTVSNSHEWLYVNLGWGAEMLARLDALCAALPAELRPDMEKLLARLSGHRKAWRKGEE